MLIGLRRRLACLILAPIACVAGTGPLTIGLVAPPTESDAVSLLRGVQLAVADANAAGSRRVDLAVQSTNGQWGTVGNDAVVLAADRSVEAIVAPADGAACHLILQVSGRTQVPVACVCADSSVTETGVTWAVRVVPRTDQEAGALFAAAQPSDRPPLHWWAVVPPGRPGRPVRRDLESAARSAAIALDRIVDGREQEAGQAAMAPMIAAAAPGGVLLWLPPSQAGTFAAALRAAGYRGCLAGPSQLDSPAFVAAAGDAAAGVLVAEYRADAKLRSRADQFERRYRQSFDEEPDFSAAAAYDAARVLIETLRRSGDGGAYREFPLALPTEGVTGVLRFDPSGNRMDALQVLRCLHGCFLPNPPNKTQP